MLVVLSVLILVIGLQQIGWSRGREAGRIPGGPQAAAGFLKDLGLTRTQRERIAALQQKHFQVTAPLRQRMEKATLEYRQALVLNPQDKAALTAKGKAVKQAHQVLRSMRVEFRAELMQILTPEQQKKVQDARVRKRSGQKGHGHGWGHGL